MTKKQLKQLVEECLNEIDFAPGFRPQRELTIVAVVTGSDVTDMITYLEELHQILTNYFGDNITFEEKLDSVILPNKDKKAEVTFTIKNQKDMEQIKSSFQEIYDGLTMWSIQQDLVIDFDFKLKK